MQGMIQVSAEELKRLLDNDLWVEALEEAGVNDWEGWDEALVIYREKQKQCMNMP